MSNLYEISALDISKEASNLRNAYYRDGAFIVRSLLPLYFLDQIANSIIDLIILRNENLRSEIVKYGTSCSVKIASKILQELEVMSPGDQGVIYDAISHTPLMHKLAAAPEIDGVIREILSPYYLLHERLIVLMSMPRGTWHLARWHQDCFYNAGPENTCTVYAPMQFTNKDNGGLIIAKGSNALGSIPHGDYQYGEPTKWKTLPPEIVNKMTNLVQIEMSPGDVLFLHSLTAHTAQVNQTNDVRFVLNLRYKDLSDKQFKLDNWRIGEITEARQALARPNAEGSL